MPTRSFARMGRHEMLVELGRRVHARGLIAGAEGNLSCRLPGGQILITPAGRGKANLAEEDLALLSPEGAILRGCPSSERLLHAEVYRRCPEAVWVIHAHPPAVVAWSLAHPETTEMPAGFLAETLLTFERIPIATYARPGGEALAKSVAPFLPDSRAIILERHGAICWDESAEGALSLMEQLEQAALILRDAFLMGHPRPLTEAERRAILEERKP